MVQEVSLRPITAGFGFDSRLNRVTFVVDRAALEQDYLPIQPPYGKLTRPVQHRILRRTNTTFSHPIMV